MNHAKRRKVLLIGWDGADWEHITPLLDEGLLPNLEGMINRGVMGNLATLQPVLSPMLWNSIATGKLADKHGIHGFMEPEPDRPGARPVSSLSRTSKAIWSILNQEGYRSNVVGWWASHPAEPVNGAIVTNMFNQVRRDPLRVPPGTIHPAHRAGELGDLRVEPSELTAADILPFIPKAADIDQGKDQHLHALGKVLSDCASIQAVTTRLMEDEDWDFTAVYFDAIDHFCHAFAEFHPPRLPHVPEDMFEAYKDVIRTAYRFHDIMLARQLELAGPDALVILCSDHGFHTGGLRPRATPREPAGPAVWHRDMGIFVMCGPGLKQDERIYGANIIDITPTILAAMGVPVGEDMDGRVLMDVFATPPELRTIPSWEDVPGDAGTHPPGTIIDAEWSEQLTRQFVALGYVDDHSNDRGKAQEAARTEADYNMARVYLSSRRFAQAIPLFQSLVERYPWEDRFLQNLIVALQRGGQAREALALIRAAYPDGRMPPNLIMTRITALLAAEGRDAALEAFDAIPAGAMAFPNLQRQVGSMLLRLGRPGDATTALEAAIARDPDDYVAMGALARAYLRQRRWEEAADRALESVARLHQQPVVHFTLGRALMRLGYPEQAARAFEVALRMRPGMYRAHRSLSTVYKWMLHDPERAARHSHAAHTLLADRHEPPATKNGPSARWTIPDLPAPAARFAILRRERRTPGELEALKGTSGKTFHLVSGLPRSGTSLMMQMLDAGGLPPQTDHIRKADHDNPRGYWEWEAIKQTADLPALFRDTEDLEARAIKVVSMLLPALPPEHNYKVIFMLRPLREVARSQAGMIERLGSGDGVPRSEELLLQDLRQHRQHILRHLAAQSHIEVLQLRYPALVADPAQAARQVAEFLGAALPNPAKMPEAVDPSLYRQRDAAPKEQG